MCIRDRRKSDSKTTWAEKILLELIDMLFAADMEVRIKLDVVSCEHICVISNEPSKACLLYTSRCV